MRREVRECNPGRRLRRRIGVGTIRDISIKHDIKHVVSVPLKSNGSPLAGHVDLMPGPGRLQTRGGDEAARAENWRARPGINRRGKVGMVQNWLVLGNTDNRTPAAR